MKNLRLYAASAIAVVILFQIIYGLKILIPTNVSWLMTVKDDWGTHYLGWFFYRNEPWQFPLGHISRYYYPVGTNVGFTDSIPLMAMFFKLFSPLMPADFQYFGIWLLICHLLTAYFTIRLFRLFKINDLYTFLAALMVAANPVLVYRGMHPALCAQWLLIASLYIYFLSPAEINAKKILRYQYILLAISTLIHPYMVMMVLGFTFFTALKICFFDKAVQKKYFYYYLGRTLLTVLVVWYCVGMIDLKAFQDPGATGGYGLYSLNLNSLFNPVDFSNILHTLKSESYRQFEAYMYLGVGILLLIFILVIRFLLRMIKQRGNIQKQFFFFNNSSLIPLLIWMVLLTLFALTQNITLNEKTILKLPVPGALLKLGDTFRASARFFWAPYYCIFLFSIIAIAKWKTNKYVIFSILFLAACIQLYDTKPILTFRHLTYGPYEPPISKNWKTLMEQFENICFYPPFEAHRLTSMDYQYFCYLAAQLRKPINIGYVARSDSKAMQKYSDSLSAALEDGSVSGLSLYITTKPFLNYFSQIIQQDSNLIATLDGYYFLFKKENQGEKLQGITNDLILKNKVKLDSIKNESEKKILFTEMDPVPVASDKAIRYWIQRLHTSKKHISVEGWGFIDSTQNNKGDSIYITLKSADKLYKTPAVIQSRPDITNFFKKSYLEDAGFKALSYFDSLPKGSYQMGIAIKDQLGRWIYQEGESMIRIGIPQYPIPEKMTQRPVIGKIIYGFNPIESDGTTIKISGWTAFDQKDDDGNKISLLIISGNDIFSCRVDPVLRPDVTSYFNNKYQLDHSGFKIELLKNNLNKGKYQIGLRIMNTKDRTDNMIVTNQELNIN